MAKYKDNEAYEKDRLKIIARYSILKDMGVDIIDLLKQSKWIGSDETHLTEKSNLPPETLKGGFFGDDDDEDSDFYLI